MAGYILKLRDDTSRVTFYVARYDSLPAPAREAIMRGNRRGGHHGNSEISGTRNLGGAEQTRRMERGEWKLAPRARVQRFWASLRVHDARCARRGENGPSSRLVEFLEQGD